MKRMKQCFGALLVVSLMATSVIAQEQSLSAKVERFSTPRKAVEAFINWQNPPLNDVSVAAEAMAIEASLSQKDRERLARQLKAVLDGRGLFIHFETLPDSANHVDPNTGLAQFTPFPAKAPEIYLSKVGDRWLFSKKTLEATPILYNETFSETVENFVNMLPAVFRNEIFGVAVWQYAGLFLLILAGMLIRRIIEYLLDNVALRLSAKTPWDWDEVLIRSVMKPVSFLFMVGLFLITYSNLQFSVTVNLVIKVALELAAAVCWIWLAFKLVDVFTLYMRRATAKTDSKLDDQLVPLVGKALKIFIFVIIVLTIVQNYGYSITSIVAGLGIGGLAVALAARDTLANLFGSVTIFADKPFQIGDWVVIDNVEGTVEEVGFRSTRIRTFYNSLVTVPNSKLTDTSIDNMGMRQFRRIKLMLGLTYSTTAEQMHAFVEGIRAIISANKYMRKDFYEVHFNEYGNFSLNVLVYCFLKVPTWSDELREKHNFFLEILRLANQIGVEFAFPTQTLHVDSFYGQTPRAIGKKLSDDEMSGVVTDFAPNGERSRPHGPVFTHNGRQLDYSATGIAKGDDGEG